MAMGEPTTEPENSWFPLQVGQKKRIELEIKTLTKSYSETVRENG